MDWDTVSGFPEYEISSTGLIRNRRTGHIKTPYVGKRGYPVVSLQRNGKQYLRTVHILMARTFIPNPYNKTQVNHIDGDKTNYALSNLEWCTPKENMTHARITGLHVSDGDKAITQYTKSGEKVQSYKSASEASRCTGIARCNISTAARGNGKYKTAGGYIWKYEKEC